MLLTVPAAVALYFTGSAFVRVFMQSGAFTPQDAAITGTLVSGLVIGLPAYVLVKVLTPNFFARRDTRTPVYTAALSLRSEEHTSELQSLMRISYAVFCLKKQNKTM